jgi:hypothetical protein
MPDVVNRPPRGSEPAVIDLGLDRSPVPPDPRPRWSRVRWRRWWRRWRTWWGRWRRPVTTGLLAAAVLAAFGPEPNAPSSPLILSAERGPRVSDFMIVEDLLFIQEAVRGEPPMWSAHALPTGDYLWATVEGPLSGGGDGPVLTQFNDGRPVTVARDRVTGAVLWSARRQIVLPVPDTRLVLQADNPWLAIEEEGEGEGLGVDVALLRHHHVAVRDGQTGDLLWSETSEKGWLFGHSASAVVLIDRDGVVEVRDPASGGMRARAVMPELATWQPQVVGDSLVVRSDWEVGRQVRQVRAYGLETLAPRWDAAVDLDHDGAIEMLDTSRYLMWVNRSGTHVLDYRDGEVYSVAGGGSGWPLLYSDRIVFMNGDYVGQVVERTSGRVIAEPAGWRLAGPGTDAPDRLVLIRNSAAGTLLSSLDLATGQMTHLGREPELLSGCRSFDGGLVCLAGGRLALWRWR